MDGRKDIFTSVDDLSKENVLAEVNKALALHFINKEDEDYLYNYRRGEQPILYREKERNAEICNKIVENHAEEICAFKNGFFLTENCTYIARNTESSEKVLELNEYLYRSGKHQADNDLVDWFHTVGKAYLYVEPDVDNKECPFYTYALDPRTAEVVKSLKPGNKPVYAIHVVANGDDIYCDVYTRTKYYRLFGTKNSNYPTDNPQEKTYVTEIREENVNRLAPYIPIIEYRYNKTNMGAFESVISLCDMINTIRSNSVDGIEQMIQSLLVVINAQFDEEVNASYIRERGMLCIPSTGDNKAEIQLLSESLNQGDTEVLVQSILTEMHKIAGMPFINAGGTSGNVGSAIFVNGWESADSYAKNTWDEFVKSNKYFDEIMLMILREVNGFEISVSDFELSLIRNELANVQAKAQACGTMVGFGLHPILAMKWSGLTNDPVAAYEESKEFFEAKQQYQGDVNQYGTETTNAYGMDEETYKKIEDTVLTKLELN